RRGHQHFVMGRARRAGRFCSLPCMIKPRFFVLLWLSLVSVLAAAAPQHVLTTKGTRFLMDGEPFPDTGISFFDAVYIPAFNKSSAERKQWLAKFQRYKINVIRIWCQWDGRPQYADAGPASTMFEPDGRLREKPLATLKEILADTNEVGMGVELTLFAHE